MINLIKKTRIFFLINILFFTSCNKETVNAIYPKYYGKSVLETAIVLNSGYFQNEKIDFVISSEPVVTKTLSNISNLEVIENLTDKFSNKYNTNGFPQAGLFIRSDLDNNLDTTFLANLKFNLYDLKNNSSLNTVENINNLFSIQEQNQQLGYNYELIKSIQKNNRFGFIEFNEIKKEKLILDFKLFDIDIDHNIFSKHYEDDVAAKETNRLQYSVYLPSGAPTLAFSNLLKNENVNITTSSMISSNFSNKSADFLIIDAVTGYKLSKANSYSYKLVSMLTYGNLFLIKTRKNENYNLDQNSNIFSFGENMIPDMVFKKIYE